LFEKSYESDFYIVYPGSEKLDLTDKAKPIAFFCYNGQAKELRKIYGNYGYIKPVSKEGLLKIISEEF